IGMSRSLGWTLLTTLSPIEIVPEVMFSSPASIRNRVDLPQPEGPTRTTNAPSSIGIDTPCRTSKTPNDFRTSRICTGEHPQQGRFAAAGGADQNDECAVLDRDRHAVQDFKAAKRFPHVANLHRRHKYPPNSREPGGKIRRRLLV